MNGSKCGTEFRVNVVFANGVLADESVGKVKRVSTMTPEQRKAVGIRLQTARATKPA